MSDKSVRLWATSDGVRVNPETGKYLEDRTDIHKDYPTGDYAKCNPVWDSEAGLVSIVGGRNEFVAFQVIVASDEPVSGVKVSLAGLTGPGGAKIDGRNVALFKAWCVNVKNKSHGYDITSLGPGWYPDGLLPADDDGSVTINIPEETNYLPASQNNHSVWVDIFIPKDRQDAPPGEYTGEVVVSCGGDEQRIKVALKVWDFALPDEIHCRGDIWNGSLRRMDPDVELAYYQMAHRHRFHPGVAGYSPDVEVDGEKVTIDWTGYDGRLEKYFNGQAFTEECGYWGPGYGEPIPHIQLPLNCNKKDRKGGWPIEMEGDTLDEVGEKVWLETCRQFREHFDADPTWQKVRKIVFLGGLDESYYQEAYDKMVYFAKIVEKGLGKGWFMYRIDGGYNSSAMRQLHPHVDLWVCHTAGWNKEKILNFNDKVEEIWFYGPMIYERETNSETGSNTFTDVDVLVNRAIGWAAWKCQAGYCQWEFDAFFMRDPQESRPEEPWDKRWTEARNYRRGGGTDREHNGSGLLIFRGEMIDKPGVPIPSIRLKAQRRGMQDYEYFWMLREAGKGDAADEIVDSIIPEYPFGPDNFTNIDVWKHNPEAWDAGRVKAGEMLDELASK